MENNNVMAPQIGVNEVLDSKNCVCKCGCRVFTEGYVVKRISSIYTGTGKEELYPIPVYICSKCGEIMSEFMEKSGSKRILGIEDDEKPSDIITDVTK